MEEGEFYTTAEAAKVLRVTPGRIRQLISEGALDASQDDDGRWRVSARSVHARMPDRPQRASDPRSPSDLQQRLVEMAERLGRAEARAELTERAESTVREERDRLLKEREEAHEEVRRLREELEAERSKGFWERLFGG